MPFLPRRRPPQKNVDVCESCSATHHRRCFRDLERCAACGKSRRGRTAPPKRPYLAEEIDLARATWLACLVGGLGHAYLGQRAKAFAVFLLDAGLFAALFLAYPRPPEMEDREFGRVDLQVRAADTWTAFALAALAFAVVHLLQVLDARALANRLRASARAALRKGSPRG